MAEKASLQGKLPGAGEVHIHVISLDQGHPEYIRFLDEAERERAGRFHRETDALRYIAAHGSLRRILAAYLGTDPHRIRYKQSIHGKPILDGISNSHLQFNLSHSGDLCIIAVASDVDVGVDIEQIRGDFPVDEIADRFFTQGERQYLRNSQDPTRSFFRIWTRKEAYIKGTGDGLNARLDGFDVLCDEQHRPGGLAWSIRDITLPEGYAGALMVRGTPDEIRIFKL